MAVIFALANFDLHRALERVKAGLLPKHILYGIDFLQQAGHRVVCVPFKVDERVSIFSIPTGSFYQQGWIIRRAAEADLIYSVCQSQTATLEYMRTLGLFSLPIVSLAHHLFNPGRMKFFRTPFFKIRFWGVDSWATLSESVTQQISSNLRLGSRVSTLPWGPDMEFYPDQISRGEGFIAAGRTGRDFLTFGRAAKQSNLKAKIICPKSALTADFAHFGENIEVVPVTQDHEIPHSDLLSQYSAARAIAIPLEISTLQPFSLSGLTSLVDALGVGKAVIMTRNPLVDIDIEKWGCGIWVEPGDINGWCRAMEYLNQNPDIAERMGKNARRLAISKYNYTNFSKDLLAIIESALGPKRSKSVS